MNSVCNLDDARDDVQKGLQWKFNKKRMRKKNLHRTGGKRNPNKV